MGSIEPGSPRLRDSPRSRRDASMSPRPAEGRRQEDDREAKEGANRDRARSASMDDDAPKRNGAAEHREPDRATRDSKENQQDNSVDERRKGKQADVTSRLQVSHLTRNVTDTHLREIFSTFGDIKSAAVALHPRVKLSKGYGFVEYMRSEDADTAKEYMNGAQIDGNDIAVAQVFAPVQREPVQRETVRAPVRPPPSGGAPLMDRRGGADRRSPPPRDRRSPPPRGPPVRGPRGGFGRDWDRDRDRGGFRERERSPYGGDRGPMRRGRFASPPRGRRGGRSPPRGRIRSPPRGGFRGRDDRGPPPRGFSPARRRMSPPRRGGGGGAGRDRDRSAAGPVRRSRTRSPPQPPAVRGAVRGAPRVAPRRSGSRSPSRSRSRSRSFSSRSRSSSRSSRSRSSSRSSHSRSKSSSSRSRSRSPAAALPPPPAARKSPSPGAGKGAALPPPPKRDGSPLPPPPPAGS